MPEQTMTAAEMYAQSLHNVFHFVERVSAGENCVNAEIEILPQVLAVLLAELKQ
jgi:hypothetical protein